VISHETGNYNTYPRLASLIKMFNDTGTAVAPFWLTPAVEKLNKTGLLNEQDDWALASERLYVLCWKIDIEDQRRNHEMSGYEWWLIQDYWLGNNGIIDTFARPKAGVGGAIAAFNAPSIFLQDGMQLTYTSTEVLKMTATLSNYGSGDLPAGTFVCWELLANGVHFAGAKVATAAVARCAFLDRIFHSRMPLDPMHVRFEANMRVTNGIPLGHPLLTVVIINYIETLKVKQGEIGVVASITTAMPDAGTTVHPKMAPGPISITVTVAFCSSGVWNDTRASSAVAAPQNSWNTTVFPTWVDSATPHDWNVSVTDVAWLQGCGFNNCLGPPPSAGSDCMYVVPSFY
jgi:hypothetical protein